MSITECNIRQVDLNLLPVLSVLFETRSVSRAAERLNLSQPAVSRALGRLRDQLGDPLFVRGKAGLVPTEKATAVEPVLASLWEKLVPLYGPTQFDPRTAERTFVVSGSDFFEAVLLPKLLSSLEAEAPSIRIRAVSLTPNAWPSLENGETDFVIALERNMPPHLKHRLLFKDEYVCIGSKSNPALRNGLDLDVYCALPHLQVKIGTRPVFPKSPIDAALEGMNRRRRIAVTISSLFNAGRIVSSTGLIATMPAKVAELDARIYPISIFPSPIPLPVARVALGWHPRAHDDPAHRFVRRLLVESAR